MLAPFKNKFREILEDSPELIFDIFAEFVQYFSEQDLCEFHEHLTRYEILSPNDSDSDTNEE